MSELVFSGGGRRRELEIVRRPGTRAMRLSVDPRDASVRLSVPPRAALRPALAWAATKRAWVEAQMEKLPAPLPVLPGMEFTVRGQHVRLDWSPDHPRGPKRVGEMLCVGGPLESLAARLTRWLKAEALRTLETETRELCAARNLAITTVHVGDPRGRWGSCSSSGAIRYSWRLILAPSDVLSATVAHEVAHLVHLDHSPAFHAEVARLFGRAPTAERRWLKSHGTALHWFGRES
ncbi:YgjP-like metallopeptidase domain-containing protein [Sphingomonas antarctica]|uniref:M48 family metallopeptidase n=1 Tax=Sphingomonas antarctica TaxID=2040274 RepID=UPI0039E84CAD